MAKIIETATGALALTFDDVLLQPGHSEVMPGVTDIRTRIAGVIDLNVPILSAAMDTVTEARLAIAIAQEDDLREETQACLDWLRADRDGSTYQELLKNPQSHSMIRRAMRQELKERNRAENNRPHEGSGNPVGLSPPLRHFE